MDERALYCPEGRVLLVPIREQAFAAVLVTRRAKRARKGYATILCMGCGPALRSGEPYDVEKIRPDNVAYGGFVGEPLLAMCGWKNSGQLPGFRREHWPMPQFARYIPDCDHWFITTYDEDSFRPRSEIDATRELAKECLVDSMHGAVAFASILEEAICNGWRRRRPVEQVERG